MNSIWKLTALTFLLLLTTYFNANASHAVGADLYYECLGGNQYRITLNFYRDCAGIAAPSTAADRTVTISSQSCGRSLSLVLTKTSFQEVPALCPNQQSQSRCRGGNLPGIEQHIYSGVITLPSQCADWRIGYDLCCRNSNITNLTSPGNRDLYIEATLNNTSGICNNAPIFTTLPVPYICAGQQYFYNHGAVDIDGDSLAFIFINPQDNPGNNIPYVGGLNVNNPMRTTGSFQFNQQTGQMSFTPSQVQNAVATVLVREFRNGVVVGSTMRDIQIVVLNCNNAPPVSSPITNVTGTTPVGSNSFEIDVCSGTQFCFEINSSDPDANQNLTVTWNNGIPGATFTISGQPPVATFCWTPTPADVGINNFVVEVVDNACPVPGRSTRSYTINVFNSSLNITTATTPVDCPGNSTGTATATVVGGQPPITYAWSNGQTTQTATGLSAGNYSVTIRDAGSCPVVRDVTVPGPPPFQVNFTNTPAVCNGDQNGTSFAVASGANGGPYTYLWSNGESTQLIDTLASGTYFLTVTDGTGCPFDTNTFIFQPGPLVINVTASTTSNYNGRDISCFGANDGEVTLIVSGGTQPYTYDWSPNANGQSDSIITNLGPGLYSVTLTDQNNCNTGAFITLTEPPAVTGYASTLNDITCFGGNDGAAFALGAGGTPPFTYTWSSSANNQISDTAINLAGGIHTVTIADANGCSVQDTITIIEPVVLGANVFPITDYNGFNIGCFGASDGRALAEPIGGTPPFTYLWSNNANNQTTDIAYDIPVGSYSVTITDANGCTATGSTSLNEPPPLSAIAQVTSDYNGFNVSCFGENDGEATVVPSGGVPGYTYEWNDSLVQTTATATGLYANTQYIVKVNDLNECSFFDTVTLTEPTELFAETIITSDYNGEHISCFGASDGSVSANATGGAPGYTFLWSNAQVGTDAVSLSAGIYTVSAIDLNNCTATATVELFEPEQLIVDAIVTSDYNGRDISCFSFNDGSASANATGGVAGYVYQWDATANNQSTQNATNLTAGTYSVTATDINGCTATTTVTLNEPDLLVVNIASTDVLCFGANDGTATAQVTGGTEDYNYSWSNNTTLNSSVISNLPPGNYTINILDVNSCNATASFSITEPPLLETDTSTLPATCYETSDGFASISATGGFGQYTYTWSDYGITSNSFNGFLRGTYYVTVTDENGCTSEETVFIGSPPPTSVNATTVGIDSITYFGDTVQLNATNTTIDFPENIGVTFIWTPDEYLSCNSCSNPLSYPVYTTTYTVTMIDDRGCVATDEVVVNINPQDKVLYVPNAFTPNGDGTNDIFYFYTAGSKEVDFSVFNRWGEKIFQSFSVDRGWDGYYKNELMNPGVYVFHVSVIYQDGDKKNAKGSVTLIR